MGDHRTKQGQHVPRAKPGDMRPYRFWFNRDIRKWCVSPAEGAETQVIMADEFQTCELDAVGHPDGTFTCLAELMTDGATTRFSGTGHAATCRKITLRLLREYDQVVHVPVTGRAGARAISPG